MTLISIQFLLKQLFMPSYIYFTDSIQLTLDAYRALHYEYIEEIEPKTTVDLLSKYEISIPYYYSIYQHKSPSESYRLHLYHFEITCISQSMYLQNSFFSLLLPITV